MLSTGLGSNFTIDGGGMSWIRFLLGFTNDILNRVLGQFFVSDVYDYGV